MPKYDVYVEDSAWYPIVANSPEEARLIAWEWFLERVPQITVEEYQTTE